MSGAGRRWIDRGLRWLLGLVFVVAAAGVPGASWAKGKLRHPHSFAKNIRTYEIVPQRLVFPMAVYVPWLELTTGLALLVGAWRREALGVTLLICGVFLLANVSAMIRGLEIDCGCFGPGYHGSALRETLIVAGMAAAALVALGAVGRAAREDPPPDRQGKPETALR
ncbi:MAG: hypothetical protein JXQ73_17755 [Phycisphaerae bacterium]|nr:hypothetical protein [Phycisphaerae bacterium]